MNLFLGTFLEPQFFEKIPFSTIEEKFKDQLKPINRNYLHLTWLFLGEVDINHLNKLYASIDNNIDNFKNITFTGDQITLWPPNSASRLIVMEGKLNKNISESILKLGNDVKNISNPDLKEEFLPHITIARFKKDFTQKKNFSLLVHDFLWNIKEISLIESHIKNEGERPVYSKVKNWKV